MVEQGNSTAVPPTVRVAGVLVSAQGAVAVTVAIVLVVRALSGQESQASGYGTAAWFFLLGGAVLAAGIGLLIGHRWPRAIAVIAQLLLLPVVWSLLTDSHQPWYGALLGLVVVGALITLFAPATSHWMSAVPDDGA